VALLHGAAQAEPGQRFVGGGESWKIGGSPAWSTGTYASSQPPLSGPREFLRLRKARRKGGGEICIRNSLWHSDPLPEN